MLLVLYYLTAPTTEELDKIGWIGGPSIILGTFEAGI
jgi:hypothetical protein